MEPLLRKDAKVRSDDADLGGGDGERVDELSGPREHHGGFDLAIMVLEVPFVLAQPMFNPCQLKPNRGQWTRSYKVIDGRDDEDHAGVEVI